MLALGSDRYDTGRFAPRQLKDMGLVLKWMRLTVKLFKQRKNSQMINKIAKQIKMRFPAADVYAHCDGPCGVYDPADARIKAEAVLSMTKKILALTPPAAGDAGAWAAYNNTMSRYIAIKEEQAAKTKHELLVLWTDFFKPVHLERHPDLHTTFWNAAKLCSACKVEVSVEKAEALMASVEAIHNMFWSIKGRDVAYYTAS